MSEKEKMISDVVGIIEGELSSQVTRQKKLIYSWPLDQQFSGRIGLNVIKNLGGRRVGLNPILGVRSEQIEGLVEKLSHSGGERFAATINTSLGYLMPEKRYLEWVFEAHTDFDFESEAKKVAKAIEIYGFPFMTTNASLDVLIDDMECLRFSFRESVVYRLPAAYLLVNNADLGVKQVNEQLSALAGREDDAALRYRAFGLSLLEEAGRPLSRTP